MTSPLHPRDGTEPPAAGPVDHATSRPLMASPDSASGPATAADDLAGVDGMMDLRVVHERLAHIAAHVERLAAESGHVHQPAWLRRTAEEPRLPVACAVLIAIVLQGFVPHQFALHPWWLLPALELLLLVVIILFRQTKIDRQATILRVLSLSLAVAAGIATAWSAVQFIDELIRNTDQRGALNHAGTLLRVGGGIWLTNVIVFALWYWDLDRGGPAARACGDRLHTDFLFAEMTAPEFAAKDWEPRFVDYLYLSFTNSTAFSPTDTLPLTRWAKMTMMFQSAVSLGTIALVVARAVNILK